MSAPHLADQPRRRCAAVALATLAWFVPLTASAQIRTDGSLGRPAQALSGPNYTIPQTLGRLSGSNLFHSFSAFNINRGESATFTTSSAGIGNVISRVTGGSASQINGLLRLTAASGAPNFYLINPSGVVFGEGAAIDVPGGFHVSTANYLQFADGRFYSDTASTSTFSSAPPAAFGFTGATRASITVNHQAVLSARSGQPISLSAGDIEIDSGTIKAKGGEIRVVAAGNSAIEVPLVGPLPAASGNLRIVNGAEIYSLTAPGQSADIALCGGNITIGNQDGLPPSVGRSSFENATTGGIAITAQDLNVDAGYIAAAGNVTVDVTGSLVVKNWGSIETGGGALTVRASDILLRKGGWLSASTYGSGDAGSVSVRAKNIIIDEAGGISSSTPGDTLGSAGSVKVEVAENLVLAYAAFIETNPSESGRAGDIFIRAGGNVRISALSFIASGRGKIGIGNGGVVAISADTVLIDNATVSTETWSTANAGDIQINAASDVAVLKAGQILARSNSEGSAGSISVHANRIVVSGTNTPPYSWNSNSTIGASATSLGQTGNVTLSADESLVVSDGGVVTIRNDPLVAYDGRCDCSVVQYGNGNLQTRLIVVAPVISLGSGGEITASSGGNIPASDVHVQFASLLSLESSRILTVAQDGSGGAIRIVGQGTVIVRDSQINTSVLGSAGNGGRIDLSASALVLKGGFIQANTAAANASGGKVTIKVQSLLPEGNSVFVGGASPLAFRTGVPTLNVIQAAAPSGVSGTINVSSPALDLSGTWAGLEVNTVPSTGPARSLCEARGGSSFAELGNGGLPPSGRGMLSGRGIEPAPIQRAAHSHSLAAATQFDCRL